MKSWYVEFMNGKTAVVQADNLYSACVKAANLHKLSIEDIAAINVMNMPARSFNWAE